MRFGTHQEDRVRAAIRDDCSGFVLYLTEAALTGALGFITQVELPAMVDRGLDPAVALTLHRF